jgi:hypothetical protein
VHDEPVVWSRPAGPDPEADAMTAIVAHGLLGNLAVIRGAARLLQSERQLGPEESERLFAMLDAQVELMQGVLTDLVRGLPSQALAALDDLRRR